MATLMLLLCVGYSHAQTVEGLKREVAELKEEVSKWKMEARFSNEEATNQALAANKLK